MLILAIDTTGAEGGVAIYRDEARLALIPNTRPANIYSVSLFEMVEAALAETKLRLNDMDLFAAASGPGSFTGIRVGLAAIQGWSRACSKPARGVSALEALVEICQPRTQVAIPLMDARRGEFYLNLFRRTASLASDGSRFEAASEGWTLPANAMRSWVEKIALADIENLTWIARESDKAAQTLRQTLSLPGEWQRTAEPLLGAIARIAGRNLKQDPNPERPLDALYIRRSDAELNWKG